MSGGNSPRRHDKADPRPAAVSAQLASRSAPRRPFGIRRFVTAFLAGFVFTAGIAWAEPGQAAGVVIGHRPADCPHAWCGCGLAHFLGLTDKRLNLAWNWARLFPRTHAHEHAAAVRHHHVMLLERHVHGTRWVVRDYNSGRHLAWLHERDVRGFVFVEPRHVEARR